MLAPVARSARFTAAFLLAEGSRVPDDCRVQFLNHRDTESHREEFGSGQVVGWIDNAAL